MIEINWNPVPYLGPLPINWYGITYALGFIVGGYLTLRWAKQFDIRREKVEGLLLSVVAGTVAGARLYFIAQNDPGTYFREPWRILAVWEGGLAYFGGLLGATLAAYLYAKRAGLRFSRAADLFAPAIPLGSAIGRISCGLAGMDYGTPTSLPWGIVYTNPNSYAPVNGAARHPVQFYEMVGDVLIAGLLLKLRGKLPDGALFALFLVCFSLLRFFLFFMRGDVPPVGLGLKNAQWTALAILSVASVSLTVLALSHRTKRRPSLM